MKGILSRYKEEVQQELESILQFWITHTLDDVHGGFIGKVDHHNKRYPEAPKGSVLNSRILWSFSAAYNLTKNDKYLTIAKRAFNYITNYFIDKEFGGVFWSVNYKGDPLDTKKQIYALSFAVYGLSEYYKASGEEAAKKAAIQLFNDIIAHGYDKRHGGYFEAYDRQWGQMKEIRLSAKDANDPKSMNTHLHVLEAFACLYSIWPDEGLKEKLTELIQLFLKHIISAKTHHLILFFAEDWKPNADIISYGHDIEAAWLVQEAAEIVGDQSLLTEVKNSSLAVAVAATEGLDTDGGLWYEYEAAKRHLIKQKHSWPQAEAMVGFLNAWQITGDEKWLGQSIKSWSFIRQFIKDKSGEWIWGVEENYASMIAEDKVGIWKCPYHNSRACIEVVHRIKAVGL